MNGINQVFNKDKHFKTLLHTDGEMIVANFMDGDKEEIENKYDFFISDGKDTTKVYLGKSELKQWISTFTNVVGKEEQEEKPKFTANELASYLFDFNSSKDELLKALRQIYMSYSENAISLNSDAPIGVGTMQDDLQNIRTFIEQIEKL